jgi:hypothetical protein
MFFYNTEKQLIIYGHSRQCFHHVQFSDEKWLEYFDMLNSFVLMPVAEQYEAQV